jgi:hypothetical protein
MDNEMMNETMDETKARLEEKFGASMVGAIEKWTEQGIMPGSFLSAIITNDLKGAVGAADNKNIRLIPEYVFYFYNYCPSSCWGSPEKASEWQVKMIGF